MCVEGKKLYTRNSVTHNIDVQKCIEVLEVGPNSLPLHFKLYLNSVCSSILCIYYMNLEILIDYCSGDNVDFCNHS